MVETFIIISHPAVAKKRAIISFSPPFSLSSFILLVLALAAKHCSHVSTKSGSSYDDWYPIGDAIVVMCQVSTSQSLIKLASYIGSFLHSCELYRLICQYHNKYSLYVYIFFWEGVRKFCISVRVCAKLGSV